MILRVAVWTLDRWAQDPEARAARQWEFSRIGWWEPPTRLDNIFPDPFSETHAAWVVRCEQVWLGRIRELEAAGASRTEHKDAQHYDWLADWIVGRKSFGQIYLKATGVGSRQAVADAVHRLANKIGMDQSRNQSTVKARNEHPADLDET